MSCQPDPCRAVPGERPISSDIRWAFHSRANRWAVSSAVEVRLDPGPITPQIQKRAPFSRQPDATDLYQVPLRNPPVPRLGSDAVLSYFPIPPPYPLVSPPFPWPLLVRSPPPFGLSLARRTQSPRPPRRGFSRRRLCRDPALGPVDRRAAAASWPQRVFPPGFRAPEVARFGEKGQIRRPASSKSVFAGGSALERRGSSVVAPVCSSALDLEGLWVIRRLKQPVVY